MKHEQVVTRDESIVTPCVALCRASGRRDGLEQAIWSTWAYVARYGMQPLSELKRLSYRNLVRFSNELSAIVKEENGNKEG